MNNSIYAPPPPRSFNREDGLLLVDKPAGMTSHDIVASIRRQFAIRKVGHGGTLDPGATGLLIILTGKGTSLSNQVMGGDKVYTGEMLLGTETSTQDIEGEIVAQLPYDLVTCEKLEEAMSHFTGDVLQTPPMVSAVKINGVPLYKLARKGVEAEREARLIHVYSFKLTSFESPIGAFEVKCGKGTYIRTLCHDVGKELGCGACMKSLRRVQCGRFSVSDAIPFAEIMAMKPEALLDRIVPMQKI